MMHTTVSRVYYYPASATRSYDALFTVGVSCDGASGKPYSQRTLKHIYVSISRKDIVKFTTDFKTHGADLDWEVTWTNLSEPVLHIYDFPDGISSLDKNSKHLRKEILKKKFRYNKDTDSFIELS